MNKRQSVEAFTGHLVREAEKSRKELMDVLAKAYWLDRAFEKSDVTPWPKARKGGY